MHSGQLIRSMPPNPGAVTALFVMEDDDFLITVGGNKITFYSFRNEEIFLNPYTHKPHKKQQLHQQQQQQPQLLSPKRHFVKHVNIYGQKLCLSSLPPITCFDISRDFHLVAIASGKDVHIMHINTLEYQYTLESNLNSGAINCICFTPNSEFLVTGGEDCLLNVWNLNLCTIIKTFREHLAKICRVIVLMDSRRCISSDYNGTLHIWMIDNGQLLQTFQGPHKIIAATNNMKYAVAIQGDDNTLHIWSLTQDDEKYSVTHSDNITCFTITADSLYIITGSKDMSLKVWQATGGKLTQVLVGHTDIVNCCAVSVTNKTQMISGSKDTNLIIWDLHTGEEIHTLAGHLGSVIGVKVSADNLTAVSGSDDRTLIVWETKRGLALTSLQLHVSFPHFDINIDCSRILVLLVDSFKLPIICLHNTPSQYIKLPTYSTPLKDVEGKWRFMIIFFFLILKFFNLYN